MKLRPLPSDPPKRNKAQTDFADPQQAVSNYLDAILHEATVQAELEEVTESLLADHGMGQHSPESMVESTLAEPVPEAMPEDQPDDNTRPVTDTQSEGVIPEQETSEPTQSELVETALNSQLEETRAEIPVDEVSPDNQTAEASVPEPENEDVLPESVEQVVGETESEVTDLAPDLTSEPATSQEAEEPNSPEGFIDQLNTEPSESVSPEAASETAFDTSSESKPQIEADSSTSEQSEQDEPVLEIPTELVINDTPIEELMAWQDNGRPGWAQEPFDCLLFKVDGLTLGVPMVLLGTIYPKESEFTSLFEQPDWFLGLMRSHDDRNIRVVDTANLVMPERYDASSRDSVSFAIGVFGCDWALGSHHIIGSQTIGVEEVKWRSQRTTRPWLAGTIKEKMCALVDPKAFVDILLEHNSPS